MKVVCSDCITLTGYKLKEGALWKFNDTGDECIACKEAKPKIIELKLLNPKKKK